MAVFPRAYYGNQAGRSYGEPGYDPRYEFNRPTAVAYAWDKATGWQKNELFVVSQGNGDIVWLQFRNDDSLKPPVKVIKLDFDELVASGQALSNYYLSAAAVDNHGLLWVLDSYNSIVYKFYLYQNSVCACDTLELIGNWGGIGTGDGQLNRPNALAAQHGKRVDRCGGVPNCANVYPLTNLHDILITEAWGPSTGIRRFSIGVEGFLDSIKYVAKSNSGGGNYVDFWYHFTDFVRLTEKVYLGNTLVQTLTSNEERAPRSGYWGRWPVGTAGSGTYRIEITAASLYGDVTDVKSITVAVDTSRRNNWPEVTQNPYYAHPEWSCFFPPDAGIGLGPINNGGDFVKVRAFDPDGDVLTYTWIVDTTLGFVGRDSRHAGYIPPGVLSSYATSADSVFYAVPTNYRAGFAPAAFPSAIDCNRVQCLVLHVTDPAGNWATKPGVGLKSPCRRGDLDANGFLSAADVVRMVNVIFSDQAPPPYGDFRAMSDVNCNGAITGSDIVTLLAMVFAGAPPPC